MRLPVLIVSLAVAIAAPAAAQPADGQPFRVFFDWGKPELTRDAEATLGDVITAYQRLRPNRIQVAGHTDSRGSDAYNLDLSARRAATVLKFLQDGGVTNDLSSRGFGERQPVASTNTEEGRQQNRREVLRVLN